ncbi:hypothetical protein JCM10213_001065 [Rhodosporidiobolus nylandii]
MPAAEDIEGPCCVCGETTKNRCGACAEAQMSLFFCSREHQKLVWFAHKRICGPSSNSPFRFPPLLPGEARAVGEGRSMGSVLDQAGMLALKAELEKWIPADQLSTALSSLTGQADSISPLSLHSYLLCAVRDALQYRVPPDPAVETTWGHGRTSEDASLTVHQHVSLYALTLGRALAQSTSNDHRETFPVNALWYAQVMHHVTVVGALGILAANLPFCRNSNFATLFDSSQQVFTRFLDELIAEQPQLAWALEEAIMGVARSQIEQQLRNGGQV